MHPKSVKTKLIAIFLVLFVCLNGGGALCVAYCQAVLETVSAPAEHCPLKKKADHCDPDGPEKDTASAVASSHELDCCPLTLSFVCGPIETKRFSFESAAVALIADVPTGSPAIPVLTVESPPPAYRGPPLDRRVERVKNCIIRI